MHHRHRAGRGWPHRLRGRVRRNRRPARPPTQPSRKASSTACHGLVSSTCSTPSLAVRKAIRRPFSSLLISGFLVSISVPDSVAIPSARRAWTPISLVVERVHEAPTPHSRLIRPRDGAPARRALGQRRAASPRSPSAHHWTLLSPAGRQRGPTARPKSEQFPHSRPSANFTRWAVILGKHEPVNNRTPRTRIIAVPTLAEESLFVFDPAGHRIEFWSAND